MRLQLYAVFSILVRLRCSATPPLALHQLVEVNEGGEVVLSLYGHDVDGDTVSSLLLTQD